MKSFGQSLIYVIPVTAVIVTAATLPDWPQCQSRPVTTEAIVVYVRLYGVGYLTIPGPVSSMSSNELDICVASSGFRRRKAD